MKRLFYFLIIALTALSVSCRKEFDDSAIWDEIYDLEQRVAKLEKQVNTNIKSIQQLAEAAQSYDYVKSITPITENGKVIGYTITFTKSDPITIYHGEDGKDGINGENGQDGKDGSTPIIGVKKDADNIYYWTLNGEWLLDDDGNKIKAVGTDGKNGQNGTDGNDGATGPQGPQGPAGENGADGEDGKDGQNGADGKDGEDGITPQLKIEEGYWYISYDNGASWKQLGKATGEDGEDGADGSNGQDGADGADGDSFFQGVDLSNEDYIIFTLADGTQFKIPTWAAYEKLQTLCNQINTNITALQKIVDAVNANDYVKSITPLTENGKEIGYTITFTKSGTITIYHGKDGQNGQDGAVGPQGPAGENGENGADGEDGADGADGSTPVIGVKQFEGIYYWTVNGEWLLDENGNKVKAQGQDGNNGQNGAAGENGTDGEDGKDGQNGADGKDGITPQLKIENGKWYVSYDEGDSWTELGQATGDKGEQGEQGPQGPQGPTGVGGDSMFNDIDYTTSTDYVLFTLSNGTVVKIPTWAAYEKLQTLCNQLNTNISSLQTIIDAMQNNDFVKSITPIMENGKEIGYTITFTKSGTITIYHGKDGKDGQNGQDGAVGPQGPQGPAGENGENGADGEDGADGSTPVIGVKQFEGIYYWTVNGEWLLDENGNKVKAQGEDGNDGQNGAAGENGADGEDGADGKDGITPKLKIENGKWYVSYDEGDSWTELGQATGDQGEQGEQGEQGPQGPQGPTGVGGDSMFNDIDYTSSSDYIIFTLSNDIELKIPTWTAHEKLQTLCNQLNTNISSLQTIINAMQDNDYVKSITPIMESGKEIGYTITFSKSGTVTIYHGKDGKDGAAGENGADGEDGKDGQDGSTPVIGVKQFEGIYYWTVNGEWLLDENGNKVKAQGKDGNDGQNGAAGENGTDGEDGEDGQNGADGKDGKDGITPKLKIENGKWYVSYDEGDSWTELGQATGEQGEQGQPGTPGATGPQGPQGPAGADGADGDSFFKSVTQDENYVIFTLSDGTQISVLKASTVSSVKISYVPRYDDGKATVIYASAADSKVEMDFQIMPKSAATIIAKDWQTTLSLKAVSVITRAVEYIDMPISACTADATNGTITVTASGKNLPAKFFKGEAKVRAALFYDTAIGGTVSEYIELLAEAVEPEVPATSNKEIHYTATEKVVPNATDVFGANIVSNEWDSTTGQGVITFDADVTEIGLNAFRNCDSLSSITIPDSVTTIGSSAFYSCGSLTTITIPNNVNEIGESAFGGCTSLTSVTIPDSVTEIESWTFEHCNSLTSVTIPDSVTKIGSYAFSNCIKLKAFYGKFASADNKALIVNGELNAFAIGCGATSYTIPDGVTKIGYSAFDSCSSLTSVTIPDSVTEIGDYAFCNCRILTKVTIPNSVTEIGVYAFYNCSSLKSITIPDSVTEIGFSAFSDCSSLKDVYCKAITPPTALIVPYHSTWYAFTSIDTSAKIYVPYAVVEDYRAADGWKDYKDYIVAYDFEKGEVVEEHNCDADICIAFNEASLPAEFPVGTANKIVDRTEYAFGEHTLAFAGGGASNGFYFTTSGDYLMLGQKGAYIEFPAIAGKALTKVVVTCHSGASTAVTIGIADTEGNFVSGGEAVKMDTESLSFNYVLSGTSANTPYRLLVNNANNTRITRLELYYTEKAEATNKEIYYTATAKVVPFRTNVFGANIVSNTWDSATGQGVITFDADVTKIGGEAFRNCSSLTSITIPNSVTTIGNNAFQNCSSLKSITIPDSVTEIGSYAFAGCSSLTSVTIPNSVTTIGNNAFQNCSSLKSITIPNSVTEIGSYAFAGCSSVTSITIPDSVTKISNSAFQSCSSLTSISIPDSVTKIELYTFCGCSSLTSVTIPDSVTEIGTYAFLDCSSLTSVTIGNSVTTIGYQAFDSCISLKEVYCEATTPPAVSLNSGSAWSAFNDNHADRLIYVPAAAVGAYKAADGWKNYKDDIVGYQPNNQIFYTATEQVTPSGTYAGGITIVSNNWDSSTGKGIITFSGDITSIPNGSFNGKSGMTSISLPASLELINANVFKGCTSLTEITIPANVTKVGNNAFTGCTMLANVYCKPTTPPTLGTTPFENNAAGRKIYVPATDDDSVLNAYKEAWSTYAADIAEE